MSTDRGPDTGRTHGDDCGCGRSRRDVLAMTGVGVVGAGLLAACGGSSGSATQPATAAPTSAAPTTSAPTSSAPTAAGFTVKAADIPVGSGKIFDAQKLVVTQPTAGQFRAFSAVCPHQGCNVASFQGKQIVCPCHASLFDLGTGARLAGPAPTGLSTENLTVSGGTITVAV